MSKNTKPDAEESVLLSFHHLNDENTTLIIPTLKFFEIFEDPDTQKINITFPIEIESKGISIGTRFKAIYYDMTNDPTPNMAGTIVSLGYYSLRIRIDAPEVISLNPLVLSADKKNIFDKNYMRIVRPLRRITK